LLRALPDELIDQLGNTIAGSNRIALKGVSSARGQSLSVWLLWQADAPKALRDSLARSPTAGLALAEVQAQGRLEGTFASGLRGLARRRGARIARS
jgi:hypothetical protein